MKRLTQVKESQMLTGGLEHFTVSGVDIVPTADGKAAVGSEESNKYFEQARVWEQLIEVIRIRANVVIVSALTEDGFTFAVEHVGAIDVEELQTKIRELGEVPFGGSTVDLGAVEVAKVEYNLIGEGEGGDEDGSEPVPAPEVDEAGSSVVEDEDGNVVFTVQAYGENIYSLEVDHNAEGLLPEFTIYADADNVWGDEDSATQAQAAGIEATYADGQWTMTLLNDGAALNVFRAERDGKVRFMMVVHNTDGGSSGAMDGGESFVLELTV